MWIDFKFKAGNNVVGFIEKKLKKIIISLNSNRMVKSLGVLKVRTMHTKNETIDINIYTSTPTLTSTFTFSQVCEYY